MNAIKDADSDDIESDDSDDKNSSHEKSDESGTVYICIIWVISLVF
jgi:hypothetical protein